MRSAPAQKARPVPVMIPTRRVGSWSSHCHIASSSSCPSMLMQFNCFGLFRRTRRTSGVGYDSTQYLACGGCIVNLGVHEIGGIVANMIVLDIIDFSELSNQSNDGCSLSSSPNCPEASKCSHAGKSKLLQPRTDRTLSFFKRSLQYVPFPEEFQIVYVIYTSMPLVIRTMGRLPGSCDPAYGGWSTPGDASRPYSAQTTSHIADSVMAARADANNPLLGESSVAHFTHTGSQSADKRYHTPSTPVLARAEEPLWLNERRQH